MSGRFGNRRDAAEDTEPYLVMTQSTRKLLGTIVTLVVLVVYCVAAVSLYSAFLTELPQPLQLLYFAVAGLGWAIPTGIIIRWMVAPDRA